MSTSSQPRPPLPRQYSKVPGGFDTDDDLSPIKTEFDHVQTSLDYEGQSLLSSNNGQRAETPGQGAIDGQWKLVQGNDSIIDEEEMRKKLGDVESSFLPELSPFGPLKGSGSEDEFMFGSPNHANQQHDHMGLLDSSFEHYQTPAPARDQELPHHLDSQEPTPDHANTSSLETMSSSPTAAAAARTVSRVISLASIGGYETAEEERPVAYSNSDSEHVNGEDATPKNYSALLRPSPRASSLTPTQPRLDRDSEEAANGDVDEENATLPRNPRRRPKFLNSRHASQRSSYSSYTSNTTTSTEAASDLTIGTEYALQTGGAMPYRNSTSSRPHTELSRSISLGSMASGVSTFSDTEEPHGPASSSLENLHILPEEENTSTADQTSKPHESAQTSTLTSKFLKYNADLATPHQHRIETVGIARRREDGTHASSPDRRIGLPTPATARSKNLTLKEQSSTIDKLQKENWDLKLKIQFMSNLINQRSEEGVNAIMSENVELRTDKYKAAQEIRKQKRLVRELEFKLKELEANNTAQAKNQKDASSPSKDDNAASEIETEMLYWRERVENYELEVEKLRQEGAAKDVEKRRLAEVVKSMNERRAGGSDVGVREEMDMWKDLLDTETARREQADEDNKKLQEDVRRLKADATSQISYNHSGIGQTADARRHYSSSTTPMHGSLANAQRNGAASGASGTLVEQLQHENAELRREVGAQTSMLTSRNREKERLYQEIEDLKIGQRRGDGSRSVAGESIFDRSASRAQVRSVSRTSDVTRVTQISDAERETYESKNDELRDQLSTLKLLNQDLIVEADQLFEELEKAKTAHQQLQDAMEQAHQDTLAMQRERDDALQIQDDAENTLAAADAEVQRLRAQVDQGNDVIERLESELASSDEQSNTLSNEVRMLSEGLNRVEAEVQTKIRRIQEVELENEDINRELEHLEKSLLEVNGKNEKLFFELESRQGECAFLREEQDGCMLKIGDLEAGIKAANTDLNAEKDRNKELEARLAEERHQREVIGSKEKQEVQKMLNDQNRELSTAKDDMRKLRTSLEQRENEVNTWRERFTELETSIREVLGDPTGSKSSFIAAISKLQNDLESTATNLKTTRHSLSEKDRLLQRRDALLESHGLESRKLSDLLEKERSARYADRAQHEQWQKTHQHTSRTVSQKESRIAELEAARQSDRKKLTTMELQFKDQLLERNNLLLALWHRLSAVCGTDWQHQNSLVSGHLPTVEVVSGMLPGFSKNLLLAVKTVEGLISGFRSRIHGVERDIMKDFQDLEHKLDMRIKRLDRLEAAVQLNRVSGAASVAPEVAKLRAENRLLKAEMSVVAQKQDLQSRISRSESKASSHNRGAPGSEALMPPTLMRHHSSGEVEMRPHVASPAASGDAPPQELQQRWVLRLKELENRLKAERSARLVDRSGARERLEEQRARQIELEKELEREKERSGRRE